MATIRRGALARGPLPKPNRKQRFFSAVFQKFIEQGGLLKKADLERHFLRTGTVEFCKSWPRLSSRFVRFEAVRFEEDGGDELVVLTVDAIAQVDGAQPFLRRFIGALHIAIDHYQGPGVLPVISVEALLAGLPGLDERQARCLLRLLECEGLLSRGDPEAPSGALTSKLAQFTKVEDRDAYLREKRRTERGRRRHRAAAFVRRVWSRTMGPDSKLWVRLASGLAMLLVALVLGIVGGMFGGAFADGEREKTPPPRADTGRLRP
jgi:hypothetical protein